MYIALVRLKFERGMRNPLDMSCSCVEYNSKKKCEHCSAVIDDEENRMRLMRLATRCENSSNSVRDEDEWEAFQLPRLDGDTLELWHVFLRRALLSQFRSSSVVMFDYRKNVLQKGVRSRVQCSICPGLARNRMLCVHEKNVVRYIEDRNERGDVVIQAENDDEEEMESSDEGDEGAAQSGRNIDEALDDCDMSYVSTEPRTFFTCPSDERATVEIMSRILQSQSNGSNDDESVYATCADPIRTCRNCGEIVMSITECERKTERVLLHTLHHGSIPILVTHSRCPKCKKLIPYDGANDAIFCTRKDHAFTRELLDAWLWDVCGTGGTFRDAFFSWSSKMCMVSASFHRVSKDNHFARQRGNEAFSAFLTTLKFPREEHVFKLFTYAKCERTVESGEKRMDGVVIDGSAVGILGKLPEFNRRTSLMKTVPRVPDEQYVMASAKSRLFVDSILICSKAAPLDGIFDVLLKQKLWDTRNELIAMFFEPVHNAFGEHHSVSTFVQSAFERISMEDVTTVDVGETTVDEVGESVVVTNTSSNSAKLVLRFKIRSVDVRRTILDFGRCFCVGSVAGGSLRNENNIPFVLEVEKALQEFALCSHNAEHGVDFVCSNCVSHLNETGMRCDEYVSSAARFCCAIADCACFGEMHGLKPLALSASNVIRDAMSVRAKFFESFETNKGDDVDSYRSHHRYGDGMGNINPSNWFQEACDTGELFPGRPQVRPNIDFGATSAAENSRSCRKHYGKSRLHTPGIFTVQCVCRHPKLLGVSVMTRTEGVSTALSALLSRFNILPRVCYYDNGCNMAKSIILRVPWVNKECTLVCDRFHYTGHTCNSICDPDSYASCSHHATSGAEAINHLWTFSKSHMRFVSPENLMPFLTARAIFLNVRSCVRERYGKSGITTRMIMQFVRENWVCSCSRCVDELIIPNT